jgi:glycosyltransferase involved in cell wall biosynthesis
MNIWLIESGEPLPIDPNPGRLWRAGLLAEALWERGHGITWWAGTFDHVHKTQRADGFRRIDYRERYSFRLLYGTPYRRTVSAARLWNHRQVARGFSRIAQEERSPDGIVCCVPTLELAEAAVGFGRRKGVPVILDYRDLWPEVFVEPFPGPLRPVVRALSFPWYRMARNAFSGATAITAITSRFVEHALVHAGRSRNPELDRDFPHGYPNHPVDADALAAAHQFWDGRGIRRGGGEFVVCFFGQLSRRHELRTAILAILQLAREGHPVKLVLCGKGEREDDCRRWSENSDAVLLPGFVDFPKIKALMGLSHAGILPYPSTPDFEASIPNKIIEYWSGGLPVLSSVRGMLSDMLASEGVGLTYANNSVESLANAIRRYIRDPGLREGHASNTVRLFDQRFSAAKVYTAMSEHVEHVLTFRDSKAQGAG